MNIIVNNNFLLENIKGKRYIDFIRVFTNVSSLLEQIKQEDNELKNIANLQQLKKQKNYKAKIRAIFGKEGQLVFSDDQENKPIEPTKEPLRRGELITEVLEIKEQEYKQWFTDFVKKESNLIVFNTCYNSTKDCYIVSLKYIRKGV